MALAVIKVQEENRKPRLRLRAAPKVAPAEEAQADAPTVRAAVRVATRGRMLRPVRRERRVVKVPPVLLPLAVEVVAVAEVKVRADLLPAPDVVMAAAVQEAAPVAVAVQVDRAQDAVMDRDPVGPAAEAVAREVGIDVQIAEATDGARSTRLN